LPRIEDTGQLEAESKPDENSLRGTETVLVVEDQEQLRKMVARVLRGQGYKVREAANPGEAVLIAERYAGPIHLLLTDIVMPGISGGELAARLKAVRANMAVLFMSGYSERAMLGQLEGAYLAKPFSPETLAVKVREVLGPPRLAETILVADDEPGIRSMLRQILTGVGYRVLEAKDGKEAGEQIESREVDLLIADLAMPEQEGIETIMNLHRSRPQLKIIAMCGQFAGTLLESTEPLGAIATISKPIQPDVLLEAVARALVA
jgi:CheY-like chemotaxis protein